MWRRAAFGACFGFLAMTSAGHPAQALPDVTLWVVQPPGQLVAFDIADFSRIGGVRIPPIAYFDPTTLAVNGHGQFLVQLDADRLWLWNGTNAQTLPSAPKSLGDSTLLHPGGRALTRQWLLGDDGSSLYVVESVERETDQAGTDTAETRLRMLETDLSQHHRADVFVRTVRPCRRSMLLVAATEPCPDPEVWAPGGVVRGCLVLTHWEQNGTLTAQGEPNTACYRTLYRPTRGGWRSTELDQTWGNEPLLDISADGVARVTAQTDDGCCGWSNGSSDQTTFQDADTAEVVFDEWAVFGNKDYDVSFFTADARIAPGPRYVALSVHATEGSAAEIRLSAEGHADSLELRSIRAALADMPMVEVVQTRPRRAEMLRLPRAELIGWASDSEVLVVENRHLVAVDVLTGKRRRSAIEVRTAADALVVWR